MFQPRLIRRIVTTVTIAIGIGVQTRAVWAQDGSFSNVTTKNFGWN